MERFLGTFRLLNLSKLLELGNRRPGHGNPPSRSLVVPRCPTAPASKSLRAGKEAKDVGHATIYKDHRLNLRRRKTMLRTGLLMSPSQSSDINALIHRLLKDMTSPEAAVAFGLEETDLMTSTFRTEWTPSTKASRRQRCMADLRMQMPFSTFTTSGWRLSRCGRSFSTRSSSPPARSSTSNSSAIGVDPNDYLDISPQSGPVGLAVTLQLAKGALQTRSELDATSSSKARPQPSWPRSKSLRKNGRASARSPIRPLVSKH